MWFVGARTLSLLPQVMRLRRAVFQNPAKFSVPPELPFNNRLPSSSPFRINTSTTVDSTPLQLSQNQHLQKTGRGEPHSHPQCFATRQSIAVCYSGRSEESDFSLFLIVTLPRYIPSPRLCTHTATAATPFLSRAYFKVLWIAVEWGLIPPHAPLVPRHSPLSPLESHSSHTPTG